MTLTGYKRKIKKNMADAGVYRPGCDRPIAELAQLYVDIDNARAQLEADGGNVAIERTLKNGTKEIVKHPCYLVIEKARMDILKYNSELGLTPAGLRRIKGENSKDGRQKGGLIAALEKLEG